MKLLAKNKLLKFNLKWPKSCTLAIIRNKEEFVELWTWQNSSEVRCKYAFHSLNFVLILNSNWWIKIMPNSKTVVYYKVKFVGHWTNNIDLIIFIIKLSCIKFMIGMFIVMFTERLLPWLVPDYDDSKLSIKFISFPFSRCTTCTL